jgi:hypothetical protein
LTLASDIQAALEAEYEAAHPEAKFQQAASFAASWVQDRLGDATDTTAVRLGFQWGEYYFAKVFNLLSAEQLEGILDRITEEAEFVQQSRGQAASAPVVADRED